MAELSDTAGQDLLDRVRREGVRRAAVRAAGRRALRHRSPRVHRPAGRGRDLPEAGLALQRAVRRRLGDPDLLPVAAGAAARDGRAERRRRRRELRRLPPLHHADAGAAVRSPAARRARGGRRRWRERLPAPGRSDSVLYRGRHAGCGGCPTRRQGRYARRMMIFDPELKADDLRAPRFWRPRATPASPRFLLDAFARSDAPTSSTRCSTSTSTTTCRDCLLVKVDIATMAHGLEGRSPMLDHEFMEFAASLPVDLKLRGTATKYIFKQAVRAPAAGRHHRSAQEGLQRAARPLVPQRAARDERRPAARRPAGAARLLQAGRRPAGCSRSTGAAPHTWQNQLWNLLMLESWHRMFIDERPRVSPVSGD